MPRELTQEEWKVRMGADTVPDHARAAASAVAQFGWEDDTTRRSVFAFQRAFGRGLPQSGEWDERTAACAAQSGKIAAPGPFAFGSEVDIEAVQTRLNALGYKPPLVIDGVAGQKTNAAVRWFQGASGLPTTGVLDAATIAKLNLPKGPPAGLESPYKPNANSGVSIPTLIAALRQAASEKGYHLSDTLASLMIGQMRGAEGAFPGVGGTLGGTNNIGAAQVAKSLFDLKKGLEGWGALAHYDSDPNHGPFLGWYWIAPSALEAARYWLFGNWWGPKLLAQNPATPEQYAAILYAGGYYGGVHPGDSKHDPNSDAGKLNVADYARNVQRGMATAGELAAPGGDPSVFSVNPNAFKSLSQRRITEALYNQAKNGQMGSAWGYLLPATWDDLVATNGVVWFGPVPFLEAGIRAAEAIQRAIPFWAKIGMFLITASGIGLLIAGLARKS